MVRARLERAVQRGAARASAGLVQRVHLGVRFAGAMVIALADDDAVGRYDDRADERIGARAPEAAGGVKQRALHVRRFLRRAAGLDHHFSSKRPSTYSFASKGTRSSMPSPTPT